MIRESIQPDAKSVAMVSGDVGAREARCGTRTIDGGKMTWQNGNAYTWAHGPTWFRVRCSEDTITAFQSTDGITWFAVASNRIDMKRSYVVGLVISSDSDRLDRGVFENVAVETGDIAH